MNIKNSMITVVLGSLLLVSCESNVSKPIPKSEAFPNTLYGAWEWPCVEDYDTEGTAAPLYRQQKRAYSENSTYVFERTTYRDSNCETEPLAKGVHKGTYNIVNIVEEHATNPVPYAEINYEITEILFEGNKPLGATTASRNRHVVGFKFYGIAITPPQSGQLHIGWNGEMENDVLLRPTEFNEYLVESTILQPDYGVVPSYNTTSINDVAGRWSENCEYLGESSGTLYYAAWKYDINAQVTPNTYSETEGLYSNSNCTGTPISSYTYPGTIEIDTTVGNNGVGQTNLPGIFGLHVKITFQPTTSSITPGTPFTLTQYGPPAVMYDVMISDPASEYLFVTGLWSPQVTTLINDIYVRESN